MKKYHIVGKYAPRFRVEYNYHNGKFKVIRCFRSWENAYTFYRTKCYLAEVVLDQEHNFNAEVTLTYDGKMIMRWSNDYEMDCDHKCYKCGRKYDCEDSPVCKWYHNDETDVSGFWKYKLENGEDKWGCCPAKDLL